MRDLIATEKLLGWLKHLLPCGDAHNTEHSSKYGFARYQIKLCHQKFSRYIFFKWRSAILRSSKDNPERNATIIVTVFFSIFLTASQIISFPPCFCFLFSSIAVMHETYNMLIVLSASSFLYLRFQRILPSQHTLKSSLSMEKSQTISKNFLWACSIILPGLEHVRLNFIKNNYFIKPSFTTEHFLLLWLFVIIIIINIIITIRIIITNFSFSGSFYDCQTLNSILLVISSAQT